MINIIMEFMWSSTPMSVDDQLKNPEAVVTVPFGNVFVIEGDSAVRSVNGKTGLVVLTSQDVGADPIGSSQVVKNALDLSTATINDTVSSNYTEQSGSIEANRLEIAKKASQALVDQLQANLLNYAEKAYVDQRVSDLVGQDQEILNAIQELSTALNENEGLIEALEYTTANRVRFDVATQALTSLQRYNARTNIGAEEIGTAKLLVDAITADSIGAATKAQGLLALSALQSGDVAPVALTGLFSSLAGQSKIFDVTNPLYVDGPNSAITAADALGVMLGKLQSQIKASSKTVNWIDLKTIATFHTNVIKPSTTLKIANINGELWIKGALAVSSQISANTDAIFSIPNKDWFVVNATDICNVGNISTQNLYGSTLSIYDFCFTQAPALSAMRFYNIQSVSNAVFNFVPKLIGPLINPSVGL